MNKETLKLKKEVQRLDKKWTRIWLTSIFIYVILSIILVSIGLSVGLGGMVLGIILSVLFLYDHKLTIKEQMKSIKKLEILDAKIEEERKINQKLREKQWTN